MADDIGGLQVLSIADPGVPAQVGAYDTPWSASDVAVAGSYAYVAAGLDGLRVISLVNPTTPIEVGFCETPGLAQEVTVVGSYAYVADGYTGLRVINVANPTAPAEVGFYNTPDYVERGRDRKSRSCSRRCWRTAGHQCGEPGHSGGVGVYDTPGTAGYCGGRQLRVRGRWGRRVAGHRRGEPGPPAEVGFYNTPGYAKDVAVAGSYAYVADRTARCGRSMWRTLSIPWRWAVGMDMGVRGRWQSRAATRTSQRGTVRTGASSPTACRCSVLRAPAEPVLVGHYDTPGRAEGVAATDKNIYVADYNGGLVILRWTETTPTPTASHTPSLTPTPTSTPTATPTATRTPSGKGIPLRERRRLWTGAFISTSGSLQNHTFHKANDTDWVAFSATAGRTYYFTADPFPESPVDLAVSVYPACGDVPQLSQDHAFSPSVRYQIKAEKDGPIYLKLFNHDPSVFGSQVSYSVSVRMMDTTQRGALVLVAGRRADKDLESNILYVASSVFGAFLNHGYTADDIYYLTPDLSQPGADAPTTLSNLRAALGSWASARIGPNRPLTLYLVDHGSSDRFFLNDAREKT